MKEVLEDIPDPEWESVIRGTLQKCGRELPTVYEIRNNRWKLW